MTGHVRKALNGLVVAGIVAISSAASAGNSYIGSPNCYRYSDNSGYCYGFYKSFLQTPNGSDYASFTKNMYSNGYIDLYFYAVVNNGYSDIGYSCYAPAGSFFATQTDTLVGNFFSVSWDASGTCTNIQTANYSIAY